MRYLGTILKVVPLLAILSAFSFSAITYAEGTVEKPKFLNPEDAFSFSYSVEGDVLTLDWKIAEGYYLYQKRLKVKADGKKIKLTDLPDGETKQDQY